MLTKVRYIKLIKQGCENMNKEEAVQLVKQAYPGRDIGLVTETEKYFLVDTIAKSKPGSIQLPQYDDGLKGVDKSTKTVFTYNPIRHR